MTFKLNVLIALLAFLLCCNSKHTSNDIVLKIILSKDKTVNLINKHIYLVDISKKKVIDSVLVKGDTVIFSKPWNPNFVPYMISVQRIDTFQGHRYLRPFGIQNPYNEQSIYSSVYIDKGITILKPYLTGYNNTQSSFAGSKQNEPYFKQVVLQYASRDSSNRQKIINNNISKIKAYSYSIHLLEQLFYFKENFLNKDLKNQLSFFDDDVKKTSLFKSFDEYFTNSSTFDTNFPLIEFENQNGQNQKIGSSSAYYLIVYWASWCGPCRKEIPNLKVMNNKFRNRGLNITSISIDEDKQNWQVALKQEKMPWEQLLANDSTKAYLNLRYNINAIPKAYLFNHKKELIKKFDDVMLMEKEINLLFENSK